MKAAALVASLTMAGILGGVVGGLLARGPASGAGEAHPAAPAAADGEGSESLSREVAALRARLEEMQSSVAASAQDAARVRTELDQERKESAQVRSRIETLEKGEAARPSLELPLAAAIERGSLPAQGGRFFVGRSGTGGRMGRALELLAKPEDERWAAIREALSLSGGQEEELKAAIKDRDLAMRDAMKIEAREVTGPDGTTSTGMSVAAPDPEKIREARRRYDDRVNSALSADQAKKWRDEGYEAAAGGGSSVMITSISAVAPEPAK